MHVLSAGCSILSRRFGSSFGGSFGRCSVSVLCAPRRRHRSSFSHHMAEKNERLIWIDCEMTGLDPDEHTLVEIACIVTEGDHNLTSVDEGIEFVIHQPHSELQKMGEWCQHTFTQNGLLDRILASQVSLQQAEQRVLDYVQQHTDKFTCPLAGNSVGMDRVFINKYMPLLGGHLHYRTVDVSSVKELTRLEIGVNQSVLSIEGGGVPFRCSGLIGKLTFVTKPMVKRWFPATYASQPPKDAPHRALDDIRASIDELRWYRDHVFRSTADIK